MQKGVHYTGRIVEVHRHFALIEMSQNDPQVKAWLGESSRAVGPYFKDRATATGLSFEEQRILLPEVIGIEHQDKDFRKVVNRFYDEFVTQIPKDGVKLQVSLQNDNEKLSETNMPVNVQDYIKYRHILGHPDVAEDFATAEKYAHKKFYLVDPDKVSVSAVGINDLEDKATAVYFKHKDDKIKIDQLLTMLGVNIKAMNHGDKVLKLKGYAQKDKKLNEVEQEEAFRNFIRIAEDKDMEYRYLIQEMVGAQYLQRVGNHVVFRESGEKIGDNMDDAVLYFKNPKNSRDLNLLKAQYLQKVKKGGEAYLPKDKEVIQS